MATLRTHTTIDRPAQEVWNVVSDAGSIATWFPAIKDSQATANARHCVLGDGGTLDEEIITNDDELRRFQYRITSGMPVESHLGTVDVIDNGSNTLVVYSTEITPDSLAGTLGPVIEEGLHGLKQYCEK